MDTNKLLQDHGYRTSREDYGKIAKVAALFGKKFSEQKVIDKIETTFGSPKEKLTLEDPSNKPLAIKGLNMIEEQTIDQMKKALSLPVATRGALMPDAHLGYGLPVGGVLAMDNAVSPGFVGFDIGCRMKMTIIDLNPEVLKDINIKKAFLHDMKDVSSFGLDADFPKGKRRYHAVMDEPLWDELHILKQLKKKAYRQLGSSGGGNHFFDLMTGKVINNSNLLPSSLKEGDEFTAIVTHSGSRGTGHKVATHYIKLAKKHMEEVAEGIPHNYEWLDLDSEAGQEYWQAMQLMGKYAEANHDLIHKHFLHKTGCESIADYENHHNFAWKENGEIVHRKGATPAQKGVPGIIPGSCTTPSYLVEGRGNDNFLNSSSHGAGRTKSRTQAKEDVDKEDHKKELREKNVLTHGVAWDETAQSYKDIRTVIESQYSLINTVAMMHPEIVIMGGKDE